jgi:hypothetical protein
MRYAALSALLIALCPVATATDWLTMRSTYSHDPASGKRVGHFAPIQPPTAPGVTDFRTSGFTHTRSSLNYGQSADNYHRVERWGDPVRPYGEWRFPHRPFSTPYPNWGTPYAGLNLGIGNGFGAPSGTGFDNRFGPARAEHPDGPAKPGGPDGNPDPGPEKKDWWRLRGLDRWPHDRNFRSPGPASPENPYPAGPGSPYPVAPYYDGYYAPYRD